MAEDVRHADWSPQLGQEWRVHWITDLVFPIITTNLELYFLKADVDILPVSGDQRTEAPKEPLNVL